MAAIGVGLLWFGYWAGLTGVSLVKGWNNSPMGLANPVRPAQFTTACYTGSGIFPTGRKSDSGSCGGGGSSAAGAEKVLNATKGVVAGGHGR